MPEIGTSGSMSGDGKRSDAKWPKLPRPSSTLPSATSSAIALNGEHETLNLTADNVAYSFLRSSHERLGSGDCG